MIKVFVVAFSILATTGGVFYGIASRTHAAPKPREIPLTPSEEIAFDGEARGYAVLNQEIARVASGDQTRTRELVAIALEAQRLARAEASLEREAEKRLGVALVRSGSVWVERK